MVDKIIPLNRLPAEAPDWPYSPWSTGNLIRKKRLGCVRVGVRVFVRLSDLAAFVEAHKVGATGT